jgi:hypothetical protein
LLVIALVANLALVQEPLYQILLGLQLSFYGVALLGAFLPGRGLASRIIRLTTMFTSMNLALGFGFWRWVSGQQRGTWQRTTR